VQPRAQHQEPQDGADYTADLSAPMLALAGAVTAMLFSLNRVGLRRLGPS
jgi:Na+/H+ antiporter NhaA